MTDVDFKIRQQDEFDIFEADLRSTIASSVPHSAYDDIIRPLGASPNDVISFATGALERLRRIDLEGDIGGDKVPQITHRIWLSDPANWHLPPENYLRTIVEMISNQGNAWKHYFWTNVPEVEAYISKYLSDRRVKADVIDIRSNFSVSALLPHLDRLVGDRKFVFAADIAKMIVLSRYGGVYSDLGVDYKPVIAEWASRSNGAVVLDSNLIFQLSFLAMPPNALVLKIWSEILQHPDILTAALYGRNQRFSAAGEVTLLTGPGFTAAMMLAAEVDQKFVVVPYQSRIFRWSSQKSWYAVEPKFGNAVIRETSLSLVDPGEHSRRVDKLDDQCIAIGNIDELLPRLRFLVSLATLFSELETRLCRLLNTAGSDKARGWHNYAYIYHFLLRRYVNQGARLLEIGIGTNFTDTPSSMGADGKPGASLRAWRAYFSDAEIVGADVDRRILFSEDGIETCYVDQLAAATIAELAERLHETGGLDVIIDDGLHTYEANTITFEGLFSCLRTSGIFLIEDVVYVSVPKWKSYFQKRGINACIVRPENSKNPRDNCFIVIPAGNFA
jgi:hypothetical protein